MLKWLIQPHGIIITALIFLFIWILNFLRLNMHYLDPFNNGLNEYEITDIVYANLSRLPEYTEDQIVLVNSGQPDRVQLARLVNKLDSAGAAVIGLDFLFEKMTSNPVDTFLRNSIEKANVVLACELQDTKETYETFDTIVGIHPYFSGAAPQGYVNFPVNATKTIRLFSAKEMVNQDTVLSFAAAIIKKFQPDAAKKLLRRKNQLEHIHFLGNKDDFFRHDIDRLLDSVSLKEVTEIVKDKIVLVGYVAEDVWASPLTDRHYTPLNKEYGGKSIPDMYGVVIQANIISMVLRNNYVKTFPKWLSRILSVLFCYVNVLLIHWIYVHFHEAFHGITRGLQVVEFILLFLIIALLFYYFRIRLDFKLGILALLLAYDIIMIYESLIKKKVPFLAKIPKNIPITFKRKNAKAAVSSESDEA